MGLKPLGDRIVVARDAAERETTGGILLPPAHSKEPDSGKVIGIGEDLEDEIEVGDRVAFMPWGGTEIEVNGESYLIVREKDILGVYCD